MRNDPGVISREGDAIYWTPSHHRYTATGAVRTKVGTSLTYDITRRVKQSDCAADIAIGKRVSSLNMQARQAVRADRIKRRLAASRAA
jgi:hypothetical protein